MKSDVTLTKAVALSVVALTLGCHARTSAAQTSAHQKPAPAAQAPQGADAKLTKYDRDVAFPQIKAGRDGKIHALFVEATKPGIENFVFYRSSTDGGKSWSPATNLSEDMAGHMVGPCQLAIDGQNRVYAVWRVSAIPNVSAGNRGQNVIACNLVYRVLSGGQWSPIATINQPAADQLHQRQGAYSFFASADPAGKVHVAYVISTDIFHPELMYQAGTTFAQHQPQMGTGSVAQINLDGTEHTAPREAFLSPVTGNPPISRKCDDLEMIDGYFDASGAPHFVALASTGVTEPFGQSRIVLVEGGKQTTAVTLPSATSSTYLYPPALLVDAQGHDNIIVDFAGGEQHSVRDYIGTTGQYTVIKTETPVHFPIRGFQTGQGPGGTMAVVMELDASGLPNDGETWIAVNDGKAWRPAVQVTNFKNMSSGTYKALGLRSSVTSVGSWSAGSNGAATIDSAGHFCLVYEADQYGNFAIQGQGVTGTGGGTESPKLLFHRF
jgi:hypothetical protein